MYASLIIYPTTFCLLELGYDLLHCFDDADTCQVQAEASSLVDIVIYSDWRNDVLVWLPRCHVRSLSKLTIFLFGMKGVMEAI